MQKLTLITHQKNDDRYTRVLPDVLAEQIRSGKFKPKRKDETAPDVCFALEQQKVQDEVRTLRYNALVLLELNNLRTPELAQQYQRQATGVPFTWMAFVGRDERSVKIVCRAQTPDGEIPEEPTSQQQMQRNAYEQLFDIYSEQLQTQLDDFGASVERLCSLGYDPEAYIQTDALPIIVSAEAPLTTKKQQQMERVSDYQDEDELPGKSLTASRMIRFHQLLDHTMEEHRLSMSAPDLYAMAVIEDVAQGCHEMGLPEDFGLQLMKQNTLFNRDTDLLEAAFKSAYFKDLLRKIPFKDMKPSTLLAYKSEAWLNQHYLLRRNLMTGGVEYKLNDGLDRSFHPLDERAQKNMAFRAMKADFDTWEKDMNRLLATDSIPEYQPLHDYLAHLPAWDGTDRVEELARRINTNQEKWPERFHLWMLGMVAGWMQKRRQTEPFVPLIIGSQGLGKSTFCRRLLPAELQPYYNDRLTVKNEAELQQALSANALIALDDAGTLSAERSLLVRHITAKHPFVSGASIAAKGAIRLFASFIATTTTLHPLTDFASARRFLCVEARQIDCYAPIDHRQLYAQLRHELSAENRRYWLTSEEQDAISEQNSHYIAMNDPELMVRTLFHAPADCRDADFMLLADVVRTLSRHFAAFQYGKTVNRQTARLLKLMGYQEKRRMDGTCFRIRLR